MSSIQTIAGQTEIGIVTGVSVCKDEDYAERRCNKENNPGKAYALSALSMMELRRAMHKNRIMTNNYGHGSSTSSTNNVGGRGSFTVQNNGVVTPDFTKSI